MPKICKIEGCGGKHASQGYCGKHYQKLKRDNKIKINVSYEEKFKLKIRKDKSGCWIFTGYCQRFGYGQVTIDYKCITAHRYAWFLHTGKWPPRTIFVCHKCDNPPCVNPDHLFLGTSRDNMLDRSAKGRCNTSIGEKNHSSKLTEQDVLEIRSDKRSTRKIARDYNITGSNVSAIKLRHTWGHI